MNIEQVLRLSDILEYLVTKAIEKSINRKFSYNVNNIDQ